MSLIGICAPIANPVYSNDVPRVLRIGLDFVPQVRDVAVKGAVEHGPAVVRTELDEVIARERLARMSGEHLEQAVLSRRESEHSPLTCYFVGCAIEENLAESPDVVGLASRARPGAAAVRRSTAFPRATTSRGLNGFVM